MFGPKGGDGGEERKALLQEGVKGQGSEPFRPDRGSMGPQLDMSVWEATLF